MTMCITVDRVDQKPKLSVVRTTNGRQLKCWTDKLEKFGLEAGGTYNVETEDRPFGDNVVTMITGAKRVASTPAGAATPAHERSVSAPPPHNGTPFRSPEQMSVTEIVCAYINAGKCTTPDELKRTMRAVCDAFRATWPDIDYAQAAE